MTTEQQHQLLKYLADLGFEGNRFSDQVKQMVQLNLPAFSVLTAVNYGRDSMIFDLNFKRDQQFGAYRLDGYKATLRSPAAYPYQTIDGIDTEDLEKRFKSADWFAFYGTAKGELPPEERGKFRRPLMRQAANYITR